MPQATLTIPAETQEELIQQLAETCTFWTAQDWHDWLNLSPEDQALTAKALQQAAIGQGPDVFGTIIKILEVTVTVASGIAGVAGAITALRAL